MMPVVPELTTARLRLRGWREADFNDFARVFSDEQHCRYIGASCPREEAWRRFALTVGHWCLRGYGPWAVERLDDGAFVGSVGLWKPERWPELELGYWLAPNQLGHGFATEAGLAARQHAYDALGESTLVSFIHPDNLPSQAVARRLGAAIEDETMLKGIPCQRWRHPARPAVASAS